MEEQTLDPYYHQSIHFAWAIPSSNNKNKIKKAKTIDYFKTILLLTSLVISLSPKSLKETPTMEFDAPFKGFYVKSALDLCVTTWF